MTASAITVGALDLPEHWVGLTVSVKTNPKVPILSVSAFVVTKATTALTLGFNKSR